MRQLPALNYVTLLAWLWQSKNESKLVQSELGHKNMLRRILTLAGPKRGDEDNYELENLRTLTLEEKAQEH